MKNRKLFFSAIVMLTIVASSLAVKAGVFTFGSVYCNSFCPLASIVNFREDAEGTVLHPCGAGVQPYVIQSGTCTPTIPTQHFTQTLAGN